MLTGLLSEVAFLSQIQISGQDPGWLAGTEGHVPVCHDPHVPVPAGGFKVPWHAFPTQHSGREAFPRKRMAGHRGLQLLASATGGQDPTVHCPAPSAVQLSEAAGPQDPVSIMSLCPPRWAGNCTFYTRKRHSPWNYMQMSSACATTRLPGRHCLGKLGAGFQQGRLCD